MGKISNDANLVIISNNCWSGKLYNFLEIEYLSPFVGLYLHAPCYIKLLENFSEEVLEDIKEKRFSKYAGKCTYPIGMLIDSIEIHFVHYRNWKEACSAWRRRTNRMYAGSNKHFIMKYCDRDLHTDSLLQRFHEISFGQKISFSTKAEHFKNHVQVIPPTGYQFKQVPEGHVLFDLTMKHLNIKDWVFGLSSLNQNYIECSELDNCVPNEL